MNRIAKVEEWYNAELNIESHTYSALEKCFDTITLFKSIYVPVKIPTSSGMPVDWAWTKIGYDTSTIAQIYRTYFGQNYWVEKLNSVDEYYTSYLKMLNRIESVYNLNLYKYNKLIELQGYTYNPLYNVDGTEEFTFLDNDGEVSTSRIIDMKQRTDTEGGTVTNQQLKADNEVEQETKVAPYNSTNYHQRQNTTTKTGFKNTDTYDKNYVTGAHRDSETTTVTHKEVKNGETSYSGGTDVFGNVIIGGDKYHTEKRVKQGNIGVTKTQELIEAERKNLQFSVLNEFFKDINEQILIGLY